MAVIPADLDDPRVVALLVTHATRARAETARGAAHALDMDALRAPDIRVWALWEGQAPVAVGALRRLSAGHGEVKAMFVADAARRRGAGGAILRHIVGVARADGLTRLSLETGSWDYFRPAHALYTRHGFVDCPPFADYVATPHSRFLTVALGERTET